jgi:hypothetical protein
MELKAMELKVSIIKTNPVSVISDELSVYQPTPHCFRYDIQYISQQRQNISTNAFGS